MARSPNSFEPRLNANVTPSRHNHIRPVDRSWIETDQRRARIQSGLQANQNADADMPTNTQSDLEHINHRLKVMLGGLANGLSFDNRCHKIVIYSFVLGANKAVENTPQFNAEITRLAAESLADRLHHMRAEHLDRLMTHEFTPIEAVTTVGTILSLWEGKIGSRSLNKTRRLQESYRNIQHKIRPPLLVSQLTDALMS